MHPKLRSLSHTHGDVSSLHCLVSKMVCAISLCSLPITHVYTHTHIALWFKVACSHNPWTQTNRNRKIPPSTSVGFLQRNPQTSQTSERHSWHVRSNGCCWPESSQPPGCGTSPNPHSTLHPQGRLSPGLAQALLVDLLCFLLDLGLITILQILTGFPES